MEWTSCRVLAAIFVLLTVFTSLGCGYTTEANCSTNVFFNKTAPETQNCTLNSTTNCCLIVNVPEAGDSFIIQAHTFPSSVLSLQPELCNDNISCATNGSNIGLLGSVSTTYILRVVSSREEDASVFVSLTVVRTDPANPIPGGCAQCSNLSHDAMVHTNITSYSYSTEVTFYKASVGRDSSPDIDDLCSEPGSLDQNITYTLYLICLHSGDFSEDSMFQRLNKSIIADKVQDKDHVESKSFGFGDNKYIMFDTTRGRGVIYNVIASINGKESAYIPAVSYSCDLTASDCRTPVVNYVFAILLCLIGLFLCFLGHRFFHAEILLLSALISCYLVYFVLNAATRGHWSQPVLLCSTVAIAVIPTLLFFLVWFFTGSYFFFVTLFGLCMGYVMITTVLFTPVVKESAFFSVSYIYVLIILCGMVISIIPLVAFPRVQNIWCTSVLGGYTVIFSLGILTYSRVPDIILKPANNAAIDGYITAQFSCPFDIVDFALCSLWAFLISLGIIVQTVITTYEEKKFKKKQTAEMTQFHSEKYTPFPPAPYKLFKKYLKRRKGTLVEHRPLLSPSTSIRINYGPYS